MRGGPEQRSFPGSCTQFGTSWTRPQAPTAPSRAVRPFSMYAVCGPVRLVAAAPQRAPDPLACPAWCLGGRGARSSGTPAGQHWETIVGPRCLPTYLLANCPCRCPGAASVIDNGPFLHCLVTCFRNGRLGRLGVCPRQRAHGGGPAPGPGRRPPQHGRDRPLHSAARHCSSRACRKDVQSGTLMCFVCACGRAHMYVCVCAHAGALQGSCYSWRVHRTMA